jgi:hypothetical protein
VRRYIRANVQAIKSRQPDAPVVVELDWDAASKKQEFEKLFGPGDAYKVLVWPESAFNPKLGKSLRGIERSYPDRIIQEAEQAGLYLSKDTQGCTRLTRKNIRLRGNGPFVAL